MIRKIGSTLHFTSESRLESIETPNFYSEHNSRCVCNTLQYNFPSARTNCLCRETSRYNFHDFHRKDPETRARALKEVRKTGETSAGEKDLNEEPSEEFRSRLLIKGSSSNRSCSTKIDRRSGSRGESVSRGAASAGDGGKKVPRESI